MKKIKLTEKISERYDSARAALLFCYCSYSSSPEWLALGYSALNGLTQTTNKQHLLLWQEIGV